MTFGDVTARLPDLPDLSQLRDAPERVLRAVGLERRTSAATMPSVWLAFGLGVALGAAIAVLLRATEQLESAEAEAEELQAH